MTDEDIISAGKRVIRIETRSIKNLINNIGDDFARVVNLMFESKGRMVFTGMGKSGLIARKIVATLNSTGTAAIFLHPTDALHGDLGMVRKEDIIFIISKSGDTEELMNLTLMFRQMNIPLVGMLGKLDSKIGKNCNILLDVGVEEEACPHDLAPTSSTTATLVMGDAIAVALLEKRGFTVEDFALLHPGGSLGKRLSLKINEIMYSGNDVPVVDERSSIKDTILEMTSKRLGTTCVVDSFGRLKGIITDGDLRRVLEKTMEIQNLTAEDIMTSNPKTINGEFLASFALQRMETYNISSLVAVDNNGKPAGIIHLHDLVKLGLQKR